VIQLRHGQPSLWHSGLAKDIEDLWEPWMKEVDGLLEGAALLEDVYQAQGKRHRHSRTRGRMQTPTEVALRLLILKHVRNWSYDELEREVRANLVYRAFTRMGDQKVPDAKTLARLGPVVGPEGIRDLHERLVALAREHGVVKGRKLRVDTTVVETHIHYPTDSNLLGDGARVLNRTMKRIEKRAGGLKKKIRDRMRAVKKRVVAIALAGRQVGPEREERHRKQYADLLTVTGRILNQAKGVLVEVEQLPGSRRQQLRPLTERLATMADRVRQVVKQTRARIFEGITRFPGKLVSVFEPHTEIIRKGKLSKSTEFGKLVQVQEGENQIITEYRVFAERPSDTELLVPAVEEHQRWFRAGQRWRTGCEGRISVLKRRHGLNRCRYRGLNGMERWVGLGVIADNLIHIDCHLALQRT
jgi:IS5 family transposase